MSSVGKKLLPASPNKVAFKVLCMVRSVFSFIVTVGVKLLSILTFCTFSLSKLGGWSTRGCSLVPSNGSTITCQCDHFTSFAAVRFVELVCVFIFIHLLSFFLLHLLLTIFLFIFHCLTRVDSY